MDPSRLIKLARRLESSGQKEYARLIYSKINKRASEEALTNDEIAERISALGINGFGGNCYSAAKKINDKVFGGKGELVGAANTFWLARNRFIGHVAVLYDGFFWDTDAEPKEYEDIESWGMLDPHDSDYKAPGWNEEEAYNVSRLEGDKLVKAWNNSTQDYHEHGEESDD